MECKSEQKMSYVWLFIGTVLMYFANWTWALPPATWLFAVFLLRFSRSQKRRVGLPVLCAASMLVGMASMWRLLAIEAIPPSFRLISGLALGIIVFLPFLVDRLLASKLPGLIATLVFPCSWAALEYLKSLGGGSWGALAYTQYGNLPLMQLASVTGIWGISFLITWFASIVNFAWEQQFSWPRFRTIATLYGVILILVFGYGVGRLALSDEAAGNVSIASVANPRDFFSRFYGPDWTNRKSAHAWMEKDLDYLLAATKSSAQAGARIVFWQEYALAVMEEDEQEFLHRAQEIARQEEIYLGMAIGLFPRSYPDLPWQNKLVWIDPSGEVVAQYQKLKPAPPLEPIIPGTDGISIVETAHGRIASFICADLDYPSLIQQAGARDADLLLIPAQDWPAVDPLHSNMAVFRAIENGMAMVKGTGGGLSIAVDPYGRTINTFDYYSSPEKQMLSRLPNKGIVTVYSRIGDTFAWLCLGALFIMGGWGSVFARRKQ